MKKLLLALFAATAMIFGLASCSGDLHDADAGPLDGFQFRSSITGFKDDPELVREGYTNTYTVEFTPTAESVGFKIATAD